MNSSNINYLLKAPHPNMVTLGARSSTYEFWNDTIHNIANEFIGVGAITSLLSLTLTKISHLFSYVTTKPDSVRCTHDFAA